MFCGCFGRFLAPFTPTLLVGISLGLGVLATSQAGTIDTLEERTLEGRISIEEDGRLLLVSTNGSEHRLNLDQFRIVRLHPPRGEKCVLPKGWHVENINDLSGQTLYQDASWSLHLNAGAAKDRKQQAGHYAYRLVRGDAEVGAKVEKVEVTNGCLAGLLLRENLEPTGGFAQLAVGPDRKLNFLVREGGWGTIRKQDLGATDLPIWLKLRRDEKDRAVTAFKSKDGKAWDRIASARLNCPSEPFPSETDDWRPKVHVGLAITGTTNQGLGEAQFKEVTLIGRGLLGEYYADDQFRTLRFVRLDRKVEYWWGDNSPAPDMPPDNFSVRWVGQVTPRFSEPYRFHYEADDSAQLWVNGKELPRAKFQEKRAKDDRGVDVPLEAGKACDIRLEFQDTEAGANVRLGWSSPSQKMEVIPSTQFTYIYKPDSPDEETAGTITNLFARKGIWLCHGSYLAGDIISADDTATQVVFAGQRSFTVLNHKIARIVFRPLRRPIAFEEAGQRSGVFIMGGDFLEGQFSGITGRTLTLSSVLFGHRKFGIDHSDLGALVLNGFVPRRPAVQVRLVDGSVLCATQLRPAETNLMVEDLTLGRLTLPLSQVSEIINPAAFKVRLANKP
jgi:hypothetical protein